VRHDVGAGHQFKYAKSVKGSLFAVLGLLGAITGCVSSTTQQSALTPVAHAVRDRLGYDPQWAQGIEGSEMGALHDRAKGLLAQPLDLASVAELALLESPGVRAALADVAMARADAHQAGLLRNPILGVGASFPLLGGVVGLGANLVQGVIDLFIRPLRMHLADQQLLRTQALTGQQVLNQAYDAQTSLIAVKAAQQLVDFRGQVVVAAQAAAELSAAQQQAGNIIELDASQQAAALAQAKVDLTLDQFALAQAREQLNVAVGLWGEQTHWRTETALPALPKQEAPLGTLEQRAMSQRLDVEAARQQVGLVEAAILVVRSNRLVGNVEVGVAASRGAEDLPTVGPTLTLELPIFDRRQALLERLDSQRRQSLQELDGLAIAARAAVRVAWQQVQAQRAAVGVFKEKLVPLRHKAVALTQQRYNAMLLGVYQLLLVRQAEVTTRRDAVLATRDYWLARVALDRAVGGHADTSLEPR
jgi:cobalt-zinc-cadmium efflux system outer membrane protein